MDTDQNLLFGVLALQVDLLDAGQFAEACSAWAARKTQPLAALIQERGWISAAERAHVEFLLHRKLRKHGGDAHASLIAVSDDRARGVIAGIADVDVRQSLAELSTREDRTLISTVAHEPGSRQRYTLTGLHAHGGIGQVWLALDGDLGRQVALKELRPERAGDTALASRFIEEARITGQLEHPGIVPVYELARRPDDGQPFYTMRFIHGRTLAEAARNYHDRRQAGESRPLELIALLNAFVAVCNAVAYAHSRRVIHRDLKPQNVVLGDFGEVVVLDWGLAKLADRPDDMGALESVALDGDSSRRATMAGQVLGTPAYMAPEQAQGRLDQINHRTDVYGLGAILYEILVGQPPFGGAPTLDVLRLVINDPPARPRSVVPATPQALEAVCLKALAKEPAARYESARVLADEVRHFLADEPVREYTEPIPVRAARWMRRHRTLVSGVAVLLLTVTAATVAGLVLLGRKNQEVAAERNTARVAADQSQAVNAFLTDDLLGQADPDANSRDKKVTVEELLRRAAAKIDGNPKFFGQPEVEATLRLTLGKTFFKLSDLSEAEKNLRRALDLRRESLGPDDPGTLAAQEALADFLSRGLERPAESVPLARQTWQARIRVLGPDHRDTLDSLDTYGTAVMKAGRPDEAIALQRTCLAARRRVLGPQHLDTLTSMGNLANALVTRGEWTEAIPLFREQLHAYRKTAFETEIALGASSLAGVLHVTGDLLEADRVLQEAVERAALRLGSEDLQTDRLRALQMRVWIEQGRLEQAVSIGRDVLVRRRRAMPAGHVAIGATLMDLGHGLARQGRFDEAETALDEALKLFAKTTTSQPHYVAWTECWLGASRAGLHRYSDAEPHLLAAEVALRTSTSAPHRYHRQAVEQLTKLYEAWNQPDQAARWRKELDMADPPAKPAVRR